MNENIQKEIKLKNIEKRLRGLKKMVLLMLCIILKICFLIVNIQLVNYVVMN